jgi:hypothetical protein
MFSDDDVYGSELHNEKPFNVVNKHVTQEVAFKVAKFITVEDHTSLDFKECCFEYGSLSIILSRTSEEILLSFTNQRLGKLEFTELATHFKGYIINIYQCMLGSWAILSVLNAKGVLVSITECDLSKSNLRDLLVLHNLKIQNCKMSDYWDLGFPCDRKHTHHYLELNGVSIEKKCHIIRQFSGLSLSIFHYGNPSNKELETLKDIPGYFSSISPGVINITKLLKNL